MTYVVGWKSKNRVFIVADSVVTLNRGITWHDQARYSSVGEELKSIREHEQRADGVRKLETIENRLILGYAGSVMPAQEFITHFRRSLMRGVPTSADEILQQFIASMKESVDPIDYDKFAIVFGFILDDVPKLYRYENLKIDEFEDITHIGSLANNPRGEIAMKIFQSIWGLDERHKLVVFSSILQSFGGPYDVNVMQKYGVGGLFLGVQVDGDGITRQDDTMMVGYDSEKVQNAKGGRDRHRRDGDNN